MTLEPVEITHVRDHRFKAKPKGRGCATCGKPKAHMDHVGAPASLNILASSRSEFLYLRMKQAWQARLTELLRDAGLEPAGRITVEGECCFPDSTRRDQGNYRFILEKALGDTLTAGGWLPDDSWERYEFGGLSYLYRKGESWTRLMLFPSGGVHVLGRMSGVAA